MLTGRRCGKENHEFCLSIPFKRERVSKAIIMDVDYKSHTDHILGFIQQIGAVLLLLTRQKIVIIGIMLDFCLNDVDN
jgi:hypothetical protein